MKQLSIRALRVLQRRGTADQVSAFVQLLNRVWYRESFVSVCPVGYMFTPYLLPESTDDCLWLLVLYLCKRYLPPEGTKERLCLLVLTCARDTSFQGVQRNVIVSVSSSLVRAIPPPRGYKGTFYLLVLHLYTGYLLQRVQRNVLVSVSRAIIHGIPPPGGYKGIM